MAIVSAKRQITIPIEQCKVAGIKPGDEYQSFVDNDGNITIIKKTVGAAKGLLKGIQADESVSEEASLQSAVSHDSH